jgi:hypothetical protein
MALLRCPECCAWVERAEPQPDESCSSCGSGLVAEAGEGFLSRCVVLDDDEPTVRRTFDGLLPPPRVP